MSDPKDDWIRSLAPGKTVADIGGLWGTRNEKVSVALGADAAFFVPNLEEDTRVHLAAHFEALGLDIVGITRPMDVPWLGSDGTPDFGPWWWVGTPDFLRGLLEGAGFTVEAGAWSWEQRSYSWLARLGT
jgi:hypothetical protein